MDGTVFVICDQVKLYARFGTISKDGLTYKGPELEPVGKLFISTFLGLAVMRIGLAAEIPKDYTEFQLDKAGDVEYVGCKPV